MRVKGSRASKASSRPSGGRPAGDARASWASACRRRARATWRTNASSHLQPRRGRRRCRPWWRAVDLRAAPRAADQPAPSRRDAGSGSTALLGARRGPALRRPWRSSRTPARPRPGRSGSARRRRPPRSRRRRLSVVAPAARSRGGPAGACG